MQTRYFEMKNVHSGGAFVLQNLSHDLHQKEDEIAKLNGQVSLKVCD